ncbi:DNA alkylation repair protein [Acetobacterium wieringae]|uniref:DNA alkylation repair protein n=1 Tax=Acetobacterium wieringae TaxID=52694 RepID=UPI002B207AD0|nr:DNA alkylation repair protein [Acetobacterium wieringae]MEA4804634.1 DNA alkylation repair protein [Acetobacterium wieringae]
MDQKELRDELVALSEEKYQKFSSRLTPGTDTILGVRLPALRKIAKRIAKADWRAYLATARDDSFEETLLQGMVIGYIDVELAERLALIEAYLPKIDNWSVCDSFCTGLKFTKQHQEEVWLFLQPYLKSNEVYEIRFGVVMFITYFVEDSYLEPMFRNFNAIDCDNYYVKMAVAWAITSCFTVFPEMTMIYLKANDLDDFTYNKALQKITESRQINPEMKVRIRCMKRKKII